jgi:glycine cleavage system H protein
MPEFPSDRQYQETHEWIVIEDDTATIGISDYAQEELNDIVYVELPMVGDTFDQGDVFAVIESVKAASDIYMPLTGEVTEINNELEEAPQLVNEDPFGEGWLIKVDISDPDEADALLDAEAYKAVCEEEGS